MFGLFGSVLSGAAMEAAHRDMRQMHLFQEEAYRMLSTSAGTTTAATLFTYTSGAAATNNVTVQCQ